jgi:hypothetical protein
LFDVSFFCGTVKIIPYCCEVQICYKHSLGMTMFSTKISWDRHFNSRPRDGRTRLPFNFKAYVTRSALSKRQNSGPQNKLLLIADLISKLPPIECQTWLNSFMLAEISIRTSTKFGASDFCRFCNKNSIWKDDGVILDFNFRGPLMNWRGQSFLHSADTKTIKPTQYILFSLFLFCPPKTNP